MEVTEGRCRSKVAGPGADGLNPRARGEGQPAKARGLTPPAKAGAGPGQRAEGPRIVVWGKLGELCGEYLAKGRQCFVEGRLQTREWTDKENKKNYTTEIVANNVVFLGGRGEGAGRPRANGASDFGPPPPQMDELNQAAGAAEDDIPF